LDALSFRTDTNPPPFRSSILTVEKSPVCVHIILWEIPVFQFEEDVGLVTVMLLFVIVKFSLVPLIEEFEVSVIFIW
jgi:hypothetical protein